MLSCYQCSLKFDQNVWYDLHVSLVHSQEDEIEILKLDVKKDNDFMDKYNTVPIDSIYHEKGISRQEIKESLQDGISTNSHGDQRSIEKENFQEENDFHVRSNATQISLTVHGQETEIENLNQEIKENVENSIATNSNEDQSNVEQETFQEKEAFEGILEIYSDF